MSIADGRQSPDAMVERRARIFRFGHYPAKSWGCTAEEFVAANGRTGTVPIGLDPVRRKHYLGESSVLDGRTGEAAFSVEGDELMATLLLPQLVHDAVEEHGLKISAVFPSRAEKRLGKVDFVAAPHIPDAIMFADEHDGVIVFEDEEPGDEPEPGDEDETPVEFADDDRSGYAQQVHEMAAHHMPSLCGARKGKGKGVKFDDARDEASGPEIEAARHMIRLLHDHSVHEGGAYCPGMFPDHDDQDDDEREEVGMSDERIEELEAENERLRQQLRDKGVDFEDETPREKKLREDVERMQAQLIQKDAVAFAAEMTAGGTARAEPAERQHIIEGYVRAAADDARLAEAVTFSDDGKRVEGSRVDAFKAGFKLRPRVLHRQEKVVGVAFGRELPEEPSESASAADQARIDREREETQAWARGFNGAAK